jgi:cbb3-type cytochrome oxidase subunit 3
MKTQALIEAVQHYDLSWMIFLSMMIFLSIFVGVLFWVFRKSSKSFYQKLSLIPLDGNSGESK